LRFLARENKHSNVFLLIVAKEPVIVLERTPQLDVILSYPNVHVNYLVPNEFAIGTPLEEFFASKRILKESLFVTAHTSDALRLLVLWKYGGTYSDMDMIFQQNIDVLKPNYACEDLSDCMNGAFINFNRGRKLSEIFLTEFADTYNGTGSIQHKI